MVSGSSVKVLTIQGVQATIRVQTDDVIVAVLDTRVDIKGAGFLGGGVALESITRLLERRLFLPPRSLWWRLLRRVGKELTAMWSWPQSLARLLAQRVCQSCPSYGLARPCTHTCSNGYLHDIKDDLCKSNRATYFGQA